MRRLATTSLTALVLTVLTAAPAFADDPVGHLEGANPGTPLDTLTLLLLFVGIPLAVVLLIATVVLLPGAMKANRYRPNKPWTATPVWFDGPSDPVEAVRTAEVGELVRGGASGDW